MFPNQMLQRPWFGLDNSNRAPQFHRQPSYKLPSRVNQYNLRPMVNLLPWMTEVENQGTYNDW
jgi:hypothetical protein